MKTIIFLSLILCSLFAQQSIIKGKVTDEENKPLAFVNVFIEGAFDGNMSGEDGKYVFTTKMKGKITVVASMVGYEKFAQSIELKGKETIELDIFLKQTAYEMKSAVVTGSSFSSEEGKGLVVSRVDVFTTPGGAADVFQAIKTFPGMTQVSESAELYVRGGNPIESTTLVDRAPINHPFTYESNYGGLFSNLKTSFFKGMYFSSGGFSAKYGNALSGVLDIETRSIPSARNFSLGISMANYDLFAEVPIIDDELGFTFNAQKTNTRPLMWLNGSLDRFTAIPESWNMTGSIAGKYSKTGILKLFVNFAGDEQGIKIDRAEYNGVFNGNSKNRFINLTQSDLFSKLIVKNSVSYNDFNNSLNLGVMDLKITDSKLQFRNDLEYQFSQDFKMLGGFEISERIQKYNGVVAKEKFDYRPDAAFTELSDKNTLSHSGAYFEVEKNNLFNIKNLFAVGGIRIDHFNKINKTWIDPRFTIGYNISEKSSLKFGTGIFHQLPDTRLFSQRDGNPGLKPMQANHYIISYDYNPDQYNGIKVELYYKDYKDLPFESVTEKYNSNGFGTAKGFDIMLKGRLPYDIEGWVSYGYIDTKRKWMDYDDLRRSDYDITHNLTVVAKYNITPVIQLGMNYKIATGRPYTPVTGSKFIKDRNFYEPIYGATNSDSYPVYQRLDCRISYFPMLFNNKFSIIYLEMLNILNIRNLMDYHYNADYTQKNEVTSFFGRRTIVVGISVSY